MRKEYTPHPYHRKEKGTNRHIQKELRAHKAAEYLAKEQWGRTEDEKRAAERIDWKRTKIVQENQSQYYVGGITMVEIKQVIKKIKRKKAPGPDEIPAELFKELSEENLEELRELLNHWWVEEEIPEETLRARVVLIYKKGDTSLYENYRPISLLNTTYKVFAAILKMRLAEGLDQWLQKTQYGFRQGKGTSNAIHLIRRIAEYGEKTNNDLIMLLLDWEKAFDKVDREGLHIALERMGVPTKLRKLVREIYRRTEFKVEIDGKGSNWKEQIIGIRQGCPLSPYLFLVVMTVLFHDVHEELLINTLDELFIFTSCNILFQLRVVDIGGNNYIFIFII